MAKLRMPEKISPMLCTLTSAPIDNPDYLYELKWDGYRIVSHVSKARIKMASRSGLDYTSRYPNIEKALKKLGHECIIDGEVVVFNEEGKPDFDALQLYNGKTSPIRYCVFDMLWLDGTDLTEMPLEKRKALLKALTENDENFYYSESYDNGTELYEMSMEHNLEGVVAKDRNSPYIQGARNSAWLKIPTRKRKEFIILGWAESDKTRSFKSLLFGAYENKHLMWIGRSGGGYKQKEMPGILEKLQKIEIKEKAFENKVLDTKGAKTHYVKPELVANFEFATWTKSGRIRKPATFLGFRYDKNPKDVVREVPKETAQVEKEHELAEQENMADVDSGEGEKAGLATQAPNENQKDKGGSKKEKKSAQQQLEEYFDKRQFTKTTEPTGGTSEEQQLIFVVQKHAASHLHYDFRLEMRDVLKSWAVPKGPSMDPKEHRLAMAVEDHPFDYRDFEGIIPKGQYGGGTVIVWDTGSYEPTKKFGTKKEQEHHLIGSYYKNKLEITLHGQKLKGKFKLERIFIEIASDEDEQRRAWRLTKVKDSHVLKSDILEKEGSVLSGLTIEEMAANKKANVWNSNRAEKPSSKTKEDSGPVEKAELPTQAPKIQAKNKMQKNQEEVDIEESETDTLKTVADLYPKKQLSESSNWTKILQEKSTPTDRSKLADRPSSSPTSKRTSKGTNKAALIAYYHSIAQYILPHLKDRPLSMHIKNLSASAPGFYIKDAEGMMPGYIDIHSTKRKHPKSGKRDTIDYPTCNNLQSLIYLINLGNIDLNPWNSTTKNPIEPDFIAIDLDPSDNDWQKVTRTTQAAKKYLDSKKLKAFVKTSGKTGMHIFIPCQDFTYPQARTLAQHICEQIHKLEPKITTTEVSIEHRGSKLFIDFSQNDQADTLACAYSVRPAKQPTVSTPLHWEEITEELDFRDFNIQTMPERLEAKGDLWEGIADQRIKTANSKVLRKILAAK